MRTIKKIPVQTKEKRSRRLALVSRVAVADHSERSSVDDAAIADSSKSDS